jgi:FtsZ-binding cell division protein ZapB
MSNNSNISSINLLKKEELPNIQSIVSQKVWEKETSLSELSRKLGQKPNFVYYHLSKRNPRVSHLIGLSEQLKVNLFEVYVNKLSEPLRPLSTEKALQKQIEELKKELEQVKAERDKYWEALAGKR